MTGMNDFVQAATGHAGLAPTAITSDFSLTSAGAWAAFLALLALIIRQVGPWRKITQDAETKLRDDLLEANRSLTDRVEKLERTGERKDAVHAAERALDRHRMNNVSQCFDALLLMLKRAPEKAADIIKDIEDMRARQLQAEATERAAIHAELVKQIGDVDLKLEID
jgi:flagellar biosynthesis/type III secretory pathway M-ring protein FliF/YscJ